MARRKDTLNLEQRIEEIKSDVEKGWAFGIYQEKEISLEPSYLDYSKNDESRARLIGEAIYHNSKDLQKPKGVLELANYFTFNSKDLVLDSIDKFADDGFKEGVLRALKEKKMLSGNYLLKVSLQNIVEGRHEWMKDILLDKEQILEHLFHSPVFISQTISGYELPLVDTGVSGAENDCLFAKISEYFPDNVIEIFEKNLPEKFIWTSKSMTGDYKPTMPEFSKKEGEPNSLLYLGLLLSAKNIDKDKLESFLDKARKIDDVYVHQIMENAEKQRITVKHDLDFEKERKNRRIEGFDLDEAIRLDERGDARYATSTLAAKTPADNFDLYKLRNYFLREIHQQGSHAFNDLGNFVRAIPEEKFNLSLFTPIFYETFAYGGARLELLGENLKDFMQAIPKSHTNPIELTELFELLVNKKRIKKRPSTDDKTMRKAIGCLDELAKIGNPRKVKKLYKWLAKKGFARELAPVIRPLVNKYTKFTFQVAYSAHYMSINYFYNSTEGVQETIDELKKIKKGVGETISEIDTKNIKQKYKDAFFSLALVTETNLFRFKELLRIGEEEERKRSLMSNREKISNFVIEHYKQLKEYERDELIEILFDKYKFTRDHADLMLKGGWSSMGIANLTDDVVKIASIEQNRDEDKIYSLKDDLENFGMFIPNKIGENIEFSDGLSMMILENLDKRRSGFEVASELYKKITNQKEVPWNTKYPKYNAVMLNMFLLGFAHKEIKKAAYDKDIYFYDVGYETLTGIPHFLAIKTPLEETSARVYKDHFKIVPDDLIEKSGRIIDGFLRLSGNKSDKPVILGDNKIIENMQNGYVHDFACAGYGLEIEDITYGLVEEKLDIPTNKIKNYVREYIKMRSLHDEKFREKTFNSYLSTFDVNYDSLSEYGKDFFDLIDSAALKALSIYASCTRKRIEQMESGEIIPRRNHFIKEMYSLIENGNFISII
ncbi:hypothetical protein GF361_01220 [Candidatus Woesearchaeota archaeon]|nr:hypothetical protein [Candidatus Woesearchaeota archaeon]